MTTVRDLIKEELWSNPPMESAVTLTVEWLSHGEMIRLQGVSVLVSVNLREWQHKDTVDEIGDQVWDGLAEEWTVHMYEAGDSPAFHSGRQSSRLYLYEMNLDLRGETGQGSIRNANER